MWCQGVSQTADSVLVAQSSHHIEAEEEVTDAVDLVSLLVGPTETLEASSMMMSPPHVWLVVDRLCLPPLSLSITSDGSVQRSITANVTEVKLASCYEHQQGRVVLDIGGTRFVTDTKVDSVDDDSFVFDITEDNYIDWSDICVQTTSTQVKSEDNNIQKVIRVSSRSSLKTTNDPERRGE